MNGKRYKEVILCERIQITNCFTRLKGHASKIAGRESRCIGCFHTSCVSTSESDKAMVSVSGLPPLFPIAC